MQMKKNRRQFLVSKQYDFPTLYRPNLTLFLKRMRKCFNHKIRYLGCGEYGSKLARLHYQFISNILRELWPHGHSIGVGFSFESASYTARYCVKKINKEKAREHYQSRVSESSCVSFKPGYDIL